MARGLRSDWWGLGWQTASSQEFAGNNATADTLAVLRGQAWEAVKKSIDGGIPAIAWSPRPDHHFSD